MSLELDHILWAAPDLEAGSATIAELTGVTPARGGSHPGFGTRNSLLSLGDTYLEIMAPDPAQASADARSQRIAAMTTPGLITFAVWTSELAAYAAALAAVGAASEGPVPMSRTRLDGVHLAWACLYGRHAHYGDLIPFAIDWQGSPHPSASTPEGCRLLAFAALHPNPEPLARLYAALGIPVPVRAADVPGLEAVLDTPRGAVTLRSAPGQFT